VPRRRAREQVGLVDEEQDLLERLVTAEAKGEPFEGKVAVAEVVLNRIDSEKFPDELEEVISPITVIGQFVCLKHWDTSGPQTLECAFGF
jgi:spore germination cell wall hydrolase CwlJ-like protein